MLSRAKERCPRVAVVSLWALPDSSNAVANGEYVMPVFVSQVEWVLMSVDSSWVKDLYEASSRAARVQVSTMR